MLWLLLWLQGTDVFLFYVIFVEYDDLDHQKSKKRPDQAIYRPAGARSSPRDVSEIDAPSDNMYEHSGGDRDVDALQRSMRNVSVEDEGGGRKQPRRKKPDIAIYVPKQRSNQDGEELSNREETPPPPFHQIPPNYLHLPHHNPKPNNNTPYICPLWGLKRRGL